MSYKRSCINYQGSKYKILNQIIPLFPDNINNFSDVFLGSGVVSLNTKANNYYLNEIGWTYEVLKKFNEKDKEDVLFKIKQIVNKFCLNKENKQSFKDFIKYINDNGLEKEYIYIYIYIIHCYSFSNYVEYNIYDKLVNRTCNESFGKSSFSKHTEDKLNYHIDFLKNNNCLFSKDNFDKHLDYCINNFSNNDLVFLDPPYLITSANYNKIWNEDLENLLYKKIDELMNNNIKFVLTNSIKHKNKDNLILKNFIDRNKNKLDVIKLNNNFNNSSYSIKKEDRTEDRTIEILIKNY